MMKPHPSRGTSPQAYLAVAGVCAVTTVLATPLLGQVDLANIVLLFVLAVVISAARWGRGAGVFASFAAVACFDFFFVPPRFSFTVAHVQYLITFAVMLVVSLVISHLTNAYREKALEAEQRAGESQLLHELAVALSGALNLDGVADHLDAVLLKRLGASGTLFLPDAVGKLVPFRPAGQHINLAEQMAAQGVYASGEATRANPEIHDGANTLLLPMNGSTRRRGVLALRTPTTGEPSAEGLPQAIGAVVTTAIERLHFVEIAHASELDIASERLRNSVLSAISHDLRTPLTVLYGLADSLVQRNDLPVEVKQTAASLRDQSHRLHRMVDNLLEMARLKSGRVQLRRDWQSLPELAGASVQAMAPWLDSRRVRFDMPLDLPLVELDAVLFERVFCNLLENAVKYSPADSVIVFGAAVAQSPACLDVWLSNDGGAFPAGRLEQVFELFERGVSAPVERGLPGVGLGLAVCRAIVAAHGGSIRAQNHPGGAEIRITLPLGAGPVMPEEPSDPAALPGASGLANQAGMKSFSSSQTQAAAAPSRTELRHE